MAPRTTKYRLLRHGLRAGNRTLVWALDHDLAPEAFALLETVGRNTGEPRRTPVGNGLDGDTFWLVAAHGHQADFVRNIRAHPVVRVKVGRAWRTGTATPLPDDDTARRSRALPHQWDAAIGRAMATTPLTIRIDLAPSAAAEGRPEPTRTTWWRWPRAR
jgi:deazaflavin-dependent oxidoreductase (nitroreductase family)